MTENEGVAALANPAQLNTRELLEHLEGLDPSTPGLEQLDIDTIAANVDPDALGKQDFSRLLTALERLRAEGAALDVSQVEPTTFAKLIGRASKSQLADVLGKPRLRAVILDEIFRRMGDHLRADQAADTNAVVHWRFTGGTGAGEFDRYETTIKNGSCTAGQYDTAGPERHARVTITLAPSEFLQLIIGRVSAPLLFMTGKLKVKGDLAFAAGLMGLFDLPKAD